MVGDPTKSKDGAYLDWLRQECRYITPVQFGDWWIAAEQLIFHGSLIAGRMHNYWTVEFRYCYADVPSAQVAIAEWYSRDFDGEPTGWHKRRSGPAKVTKAEENVT